MHLLLRYEVSASSDVTTKSYDTFYGIAESFFLSTILAICSQFLMVYALNSGIKQILQEFIVFDTLQSIPHAMILSLLSLETNLNDEQKGVD